MKDKSDRELAVGDYIVYGHALGRCAGLQYGKVIAFTKGADHRSYNAAEIEKVKVIGVTWDWEGKYYPPKLNKPSILMFSSRILKITEDQIHPRVLELLKNA